MSLTIPDDVLRAAGMTEEELRRDIAVMLYASGKLSFGKAKELAGMHHSEFQHLLGSRDVYMNYSIEDFEQDMKTLRELKRS